MIQLQTLHEFLTACQKKCGQQKDACARYFTATTYLAGEVLSRPRPAFQLCSGSERRTHRAGVKQVLRALD